MAGRRAGAGQRHHLWYLPDPERRTGPAHRLAAAGGVCHVRVDRLLRDPVPGAGPAAGGAGAAGAGDVAVSGQRGVLHRAAGVADHGGGVAHRRADGVAGRHDRPGVDAAAGLLAAGRACQRRAAGRQRAGDGRHVFAVGKENLIRGPARSGAVTDNRQGRNTWIWDCAASMRWYAAPARAWASPAPMRWRPRASTW
ncbi:hypothetical protein CBM2609_A60380 [Cupriavidus taiwanensis]|nr:hypothetical protein CBM2604_A50380 [Cupriavidus taiwanensis]SOZ27783.1 hypothetical protein CBM2609_A60380 [Cupriavidus taiwanensis]